MTRDCFHMPISIFVNYHRCRSYGKDVRDNVARIPCMHVMLPMLPISVFVITVPDHMARTFGPCQDPFCMQERLFINRLFTRRSRRLSLNEKFIDGCDHCLRRPSPTMV